MIDIGIQLFLRHPISIKYNHEVNNTELLVLTNQSSSGYLINFGYKFFDKAVEANMLYEM